MRRWLLLLLICMPCGAQNDRTPTHKTDSTPPSHSIYTKQYHLQYANLQSAIKLLLNMIKLDRHSTLQVTPYQRTRLLFLHGTQKDIQKALQWLKTIDTPNTQIEISAQIVNMDKKFVQNLGVSLSQNDTQTPNTITIPIWTMQALNLLNIKIQTLCKQGHADILANPQLTTLNQHPAAIEAGTEIPYQEKTKRGDTTIQFKKASLKLKITPTILNSHKVLLKINLHHDTPSIWMIKGEPAIKTQQLNTTVVIENNHTMVLGGIISESSKVDTHSIPILHQLPFIGHFFESKETIKRKSELLLILTPHYIFPPKPTK